MHERWYWPPVEQVGMAPLVEAKVRKKAKN